MELEQQRFFRYVFPGIATVMVTVGVFLVVDSELLRELYKWLGGRIWEGGLLAFVASGALGFVLSQMYFAIPCLSVANHTPVSQKLLKYLNKLCGCQGGVGAVISPNGVQNVDKPVHHGDDRLLVGFAVVSMALENGLKVAIIADGSLAGKV